MQTGTTLVVASSSYITYIKESGDNAKCDYYFQ